MHESASAVFARSLNLLIALDEERSLTQAALRCGVSQPTLSRVVRSWEARLGTPLVEARGRAVTLTDDGRVIAAAARSAIATFQRELAGSRADEPERLHIGYLRSLGATVVAELVSSFLALRAGAPIGHHEGSSTELLQALHRNEIHVAITAPQPAEGLGWFSLGSQRLVLMVSVSHRFATRESASLEDFRDEPFLALSHDFHTRALADDLCRRAGFSANVVIEVDNLAAAARYVGAGLGVLIAPADAAPHPRVVSLPIHAVGAQREFGIVWRRDAPSEQVERFLQCAEDLAQRYPHWADIDG